MLKFMTDYIQKYEWVCPKEWPNMSKCMTEYVQKYDILCQKVWQIISKVWLSIYKSMSEKITENVEKYDRVCLKVWLGIYISLKNVPESIKSMPKSKAT